MLAHGAPIIPSMMAGAGIGAATLVGGKAYQSWMSKPNTVFKFLAMAEKAKRPLAKQYFEIWANSGIEATTAYISQLPPSALRELKRTIPSMMVEAARQDPEFFDETKASVRNAPELSNVERARLLVELNQGQLPSPVTQSLDLLSNPEIYEQAAQPPSTSAPPLPSK
jgi:hypothetical protein